MANLKKLKEFSHILRVRLESLKKRKEGMKKELDELQDQNKIISNMTGKRKELVRRTEEMDRVIPRLDEEHLQVKGDLDEKKSALEAHPEYAPFSEVENRISENEYFVCTLKTSLDKVKRSIKMGANSNPTENLTGEINEVKERLI